MTPYLLKNMNRKWVLFCCMNERRLLVVSLFGAAPNVFVVQTLVSQLHRVLHARSNQQHGCLLLGYRGSTLSTLSLFDPSTTRGGGGLKACGRVRTQLVEVSIGTEKPLQKAIKTRHGFGMTM